MRYYLPWQMPAWVDSQGGDGRREQAVWTPDKRFGYRKKHQGINIINININIDINIMTAKSY